MNRRSFLRSLAKAAGIVALAPQLAFRAKPLQVQVVDAFWFQEERASMRVSDEYAAFVAQLEARTFQFAPSFQDFLRQQKNEDFWAKRDHASRLHHQRLPAVQLHQAGSAADPPAGS